MNTTNPTATEKERLDEVKSELRTFPSRKSISSMPTLESLRESISDMARRTTKFMVFFSRLLLYHIHRVLDNGLPFPKLTKTDLQVFKQLSSPDAHPATLAANRRKHPEFATSLNEFLSLLPEEERIQFSTKGLLTNLGIPMNYELAKHATAIQNHLVCNFSERCSRWISFRVRSLEPTLAAPTRKQLERAILAKLLVVESDDASEQQQQQQQYQQPTIFKPTEKQQRKTIHIITKELKDLLSSSVPVNNEWLRNQDNWKELLNFYRSLNSLFMENQLKQFDLLPLCSFKTRCITLDHSVFCMLFNIPSKERKLVPWTRFIRPGHVHVDKFPGTNRRIVTSIQTDGVKFVVLCEKFVPKSKMTSQDVLAGAALGNAGDGGDDGAVEGDLDNLMQMQDMITAGGDKTPKRRKTQKNGKSKPATTTTTTTPTERRIFTESRGVIKMTELERFTGPIDIIGVDPGVTDMFAVVDSRNHYSKLTKKRYKTVVGINGNSRKLERWTQSSGSISSISPANRTPSQVRVCRLSTTTSDT